MVRFALLCWLFSQLNKYCRHSRLWKLLNNNNIYESSCQQAARELDYKIFLAIWSHYPWETWEGLSVADNTPEVEVLLYALPPSGLANADFLKMGQSRPLFVCFRSFLVTISIQIEKSVDAVCGIWTWGSRRVGADKTTALWRPLNADFFTSLLNSFELKSQQLFGLHLY